MSSKEVRDAVGEAPARRDKGKSAVVLLTEKRQALDTARKNYATTKAARDEVAMGDQLRLIESLKAILQELEVEAKAEEEAAAREESERRLVAIKRAYGSQLDEYAEDDQRVEECRKQLADAITKRNARAGKLEVLEREANALSDRFEFPQTKFDHVSEPKPIDLPKQWRTTVSKPQFEETKDGTRRSRRSYEEISDSPGYEIIHRVGPKPFRELTPAEKEALSEKENRQPDPVLAQAAVEANALGSLGIPAGGIARR